MMHGQKNIKLSGVVFDRRWITSLYIASRGSCRNALDLAVEKYQNYSAEKLITA